MVANSTDVGPEVSEQLEAAPVTVQLNDPVGAGFPVVPVTTAVNVSWLPTVGLEGDSMRLIDGVETPSEIVIPEEVLVT